MGNKMTLTLIYVIVNYGLGSNVLKVAEKTGIRGGVVFLGMGTKRSKILEFLELTDVRKEIVLMAAEEAVTDIVMESIDKEFEFKKPNHGIAFTMPLTELVSNSRTEYGNNINGGAKNTMYNSIFTIVDKDKAEIVMEAATGAGAKGGTVMRARGAGTHEESKVFHMDIEPEKEIVIILAKVEDTEKIVTAIRDRIEIGKGGRGVIFCQDVSRIYGITE